LNQKFPLASNDLVHLFLFALRGKETSLYLFIPYEQLSLFFGTPIT
jgi:hypothetical protein